MSNGSGREAGKGEWKSNFLIKIKKNKQQLPQISVVQVHHSKAMFFMEQDPIWCIGIVMIQSS